MSPIEAMLLGALERFAPDHIKIVSYKGGSLIPYKHTFALEGAQEHPGSLIVARDVVLSSYRLDFAICAGGMRGCAWFAVECDGHNFHDRTKQQAAADRSRDRELLVMGVPALRFTGSEIVHYEDRCARDVFAMADAIWAAAYRDLESWREGWDAAHREIREDSAEGAVIGAVGEMR